LSYHSYREDGTVGRRHRRVLALTLAASLSSMLLGVSVAGAVGQTVGQSAPAPNNGAVANAIAASLKLRSLPSSLNPSLTAIANGDVNNFQGTDMLKQDCDPYTHMQQVFSPKPCIYGAIKRTRTIVIFGDSYVGNWLPALAEVGTNLGYRIAAFEFPGCLTTFVDPTAGPGGEDPAQVKACEEWHTHLPAAVRALKPFAILAANGAESWGVAGDKGWIEGMQKAFDEMTTTSPKTIRVQIQESPHLPAPAPTCLAAYASSIQKCDLTYQPGVLGVGLFSGTLVRDQKAAAAAGAALLPTVQWLCVKDRCPAVVGHMLVYVDEDHLTTVYSQYLATVLQKALVPILRHG
jgi:hypothetical protein